MQDIPVLEYHSMVTGLQSELAAGARVCAFFGYRPKGPSAPLRLGLLLAREAGAALAMAAMDVGKSYPSLTPEVPALHLFEREIYEQFQVRPEKHPWLKPLRYTGPGRSPEQNPGDSIGRTKFFRVEGADVHEVSVGPIHAGVIECGHFRFQCLGETVMHLEVSLGYHHRGVEDMLNRAGAPGGRTILPLLETMAGDSSVAHTWAHCAIIEALSGFLPSPRGQAIRAAALELERLANHVGDLGALAGDMGYLPTSSFCGRLRGDYLNMSAVICGNRFGRGLVRPGGAGFDLDETLCRELLRRLEATTRDVHGAVELMWDSPSVTARMMGIGVVTHNAARDLGLVGPAARASGLSLDARYYHTPAGLREFRTEPPVMDSGDVYARARVRQAEIRSSAFIISGLLRTLPEGEPCAVRTNDGLAPESLCASLVEGWRGEVCHVALTGKDGRFMRYKVVDPSFHNWMGLAMALRGGQISDFPLCNKSFNLSYCGVDL
ncbi:MAG: hydrogenase [Deltaproteobacteria bacterium]|nr:hydrogenase [Deltaproteobacteria bacterium]